MKQIVLSILFCLMAINVVAQKHRTFNERLFNAKVAEITYLLNLSDKQVADFSPIYMQYNKDMIAAWGTEENMKGSPKTSEEVAALVKHRMARQQRAQEIRMNYTDKFAKVLSPNQLQKFYKVENGIQKRLRERKLHKSSNLRQRKR